MQFKQKTKAMALLLAFAMLVAMVPTMPTFADDAKNYVRKAEFRKAGSEEQMRIIGPVFNPDVKVLEKDGKTTYVIGFKTVEAMGVKEDLSEIKVEAKAGDGDFKVIKSEVVDGDYKNQFTFTRDAVNEEKIDVDVVAKAMGGQVFNGCIFFLEEPKVEDKVQNGTDTDKDKDKDKDKKKDKDINIEKKDDDDDDESGKRVTPAGSTKNSNKTAEVEVKNKAKATVAVLADGEKQKAKSILTEKTIYSQTRPAYELTYKNSDNAKTLTASLPYKLQSGEEAEAIVIYMFDQDGEAVVVKNSEYNSKEKMVTFTVNDLNGKFVIGHNQKVFVDVIGHWAKSSVDYLAAREIVHGMNDENFAPDNKIRRAELIQILANLSGDDLNAYTSTTYKDVSANAWYAKAVAWAEAKGVIGETASENFAPESDLTREDMAVMIANYITKVEQAKLANVKKNAAFADASEIADYAVNAVELMQKAGIINGIKADNGVYNFNPKGTATRAEVAKMLATYLRD